MTVINSVGCVNSASVKYVDYTTRIKEWTKTLAIVGKTVTFKLDTGAEVNILPLNVLELLQPDSQMQNCNVEAFGVSRIKPMGFTLCCE